MHISLPEMAILLVHTYPHSTTHPPSPHHGTYVLFRRYKRIEGSLISAMALLPGWCHEVALGGSVFIQLKALPLKF